MNCALKKNTDRQQIGKDKNELRNLTEMSIPPPQPTNIKIVKNK